MFNRLNALLLLIFLRYFLNTKNATLAAPDTQTQGTTIPSDMFTTQQFPTTNDVSQLNQATTGVPQSTGQFPSNIPFNTMTPTNGVPTSMPISQPFNGVQPTNNMPFNGGSNGAMVGVPPMTMNSVNTNSVPFSNSQFGTTSIPAQSFSTGSPNQFPITSGPVPTAATIGMVPTIVGPVSPFTQPADASSSIKANQLIADYQRLSDSHQNMHDVVKTSVINQATKDNMCAAHIGKAQMVAYQITDDQALTPNDKAYLKNSLNNEANIFKKSMDAAYARLANSAYAKSLKKNADDLNNIDEINVMANYMANIQAKINENTAGANNLNRNYFTPIIQKFLAAINGIIAEYQKRNPRANISTTSSSGAGPTVQ